MAVSSASRNGGNVVMLRRSATQQFDAPVLVWWPDEAGKLAELRDDGQLRLIVVQDGAEPPISGDPLEDWVRSSDSASIPDRIAGLVARARPIAHPEPRRERSAPCRCPVDTPVPERDPDRTPTHRRLRLDRLARRHRGRCRLRGRDSVDRARCHAPEDASAPQPGAERRARPSCRTESRVRPHPARGSRNGHPALRVVTRGLL